MGAGPGNGHDQRPVFGKIDINQGDAVAEAAGCAGGRVNPGGVPDTGLSGVKSMWRKIEEDGVDRSFTREPGRGPRPRRGTALRAACLIVPFLVSGAAADDSFKKELGDFEASLSLGYDLLDLPAVRFTTRNAYDSGSVVGTETNFSNPLAGQRLSGELAGPLGDIGGIPVRAVISGYYAGVSGVQTTACTPDDIATYCYWPVLLDDPSLPQGLYNYFADETARIHTRRAADLWGLSLGLAAELPNLNGVTLKGGADYRHIGVDTALDISCPTVECDAEGITSRYREGLVTTYVGAFVGLDSRIPLGTDAVLDLGGQIGLYSAHAGYRGHEVQTYPGYPDDIYDLRLSRRHAGVIGAVQAGLSQRIGRATLSVYDRLEWVSWAPRMKYNNDDQTPDPPGPDGSWTGTQVGTEIGNGHLWSNTLGLKMRWVF